MLRIRYAMGVAALLLLQVSSSFAAEGEHQNIVAPDGKSIGIGQATSDEIYQTAASKIQGEGDQLAGTDVALQQPTDQSEAASNGMTMEYPALALLAMVFISMAALSRRDSLGIDR